MAQQTLNNGETGLSFRTKLNDNFTDLYTNKVDVVAGKGLSTEDYTTAEKADLAANTSARHTHSNKAVLDAITASYTTADATKLAGTAAGAASSTDNALARFDLTTGKILQNGIVTQSDSGILSNIESSDFSLTPAVTTHTAGRLRWNADEHTLDIDTDLSDVSLQINQETVTPFYNDTGSIIPDGSAVIVRGLFGDLPTVVLALSDNIDNIQGNIFVTTNEVGIAGTGMMTKFGKVRGIDTSSFSIGDPLYISSTVAGELTNTKPVFPNYSIRIGQVVTSAVSGTIGINQTEFVSDTFNDAFDGSFRETVKFTVTSDGATITGSLVNADLTNDLTMVFSDGLTILDVTPALTITLTAGTDTNPQDNYIYIPLSTKVLTLSTTGFPATEHIKVAYIVTRSATATQTDGALVNQNVNDHIKSDLDNGHILHITERLRLESPKWRSGVTGSATIVGTGTGTPDTVTIDNTSGIVYQLHDQVFPLLDMASGDPIHMVNDFTTAFKEVTNLGTEQSDALGVTLNNTSYSVVVWGIQNKTGETCHLMANLPTGSYAFASPTDAVNDADNHSVYDIPSLYTTVGFLIARFTFTLKNNEFVLIDTQDLRGKISNTVAGGGGGGGGVTDFTALTDTPSSYVGQALKLLQVNAGETALEFIDNSALNTSTDTTNFNNNLSAADTDVQKALDTIDNLSFGTVDTNAIHDNVAGEIALITEKISPVNADLVIIEDSAAANAKKRVQVGNLPTAGGGETNTASNVGTAGVGVFKQKTGVDLEFKKINAGSSKVTITDDTGNDEIDIDVVEANLTLSNLGGSVTDAQVPDTITLSNITQITNRSHTGLSDIGTNSHAQIDTHIADTANPHSVTATQVGLGNVDNTSDATKNSATATLTNKTIALSNNTISGSTSDFNAALSDGSFATLGGTETLTNKTLTDPKIVTTINAQTGTTYTLALTDASKLVTLSNAAAITLTIPTNAVTAFSVGTQIDLTQQGAGAVTIAGAGVTINAKDAALTSNGQYVGLTLVKIATDTWNLYGDLV